MYILSVYNNVFMLWLLAYKTNLPIFMKVSNIVFRDIRKA